MKHLSVLVAEDEPAIAQAIKARLESDHVFDVDVVATGAEALRRVVASTPDALLLDTTLPDVSGSEVCRVIRSRERTANLPVIMLADRSGVRAAEGLELGADDYLAKPFDLGELEARLKAVLRRHAHRPSPRDDAFKGVHLEADFAAVSVAVDGQPVTLTKREFLLLRCLVHHCNEVVNRDAILADVWNDNGWNCRVVDSAVYKLRTKLGAAGRQVETVARFGYRFNEPPTPT